MGGTYGTKTLKDDANSATAKRTTLDYMVVAIPIGKLGVGFGLMPFSSVGYKNVRDNSAIAAPGNANHEMGTARMGKDPKSSVLNGFNQMHAVKNVFITDGSCMSSISCVNPSITFMALTARACDYAVKALKRGDI